MTIGQRTIQRSSRLSNLNHTTGTNTSILHTSKHMITSTHIIHRTTNNLLRIFKLHNNRRIMNMSTHAVLNTMLIYKRNLSNIISNRTNSRRHTTAHRTGSHRNRPTLMTRRITNHSLIRGQRPLPCKAGTLRRSTLTHLKNAQARRLNKLLNRLITRNRYHNRTSTNSRRSTNGYTRTNQRIRQRNQRNMRRPRRRRRRLQ